MGRHRVENRLQKMQPPVPTQRRKDIDGLRALAIIMVVSMHVGLVNIHGGVDVSFVLSGFLNTFILFKEIERIGTAEAESGQVKTHRKVFLHFVARRFRRLVPGAALVIGLTLLFVWKFTPLQFRAVATDASLAAISGLNWRLVSEGTDYFAANGTQTPFQHYWSLCIEEQFYLLLAPVLMITALIGRKLFRSHRVVTVVVMAAVVGWSFYECIHLTAVNQPLAYFGSYTRVWELAAGALLGLSVSQLSRMNHVFAAVLSWAGLAGIVVSGMLITNETPLPGYAVLGPVVGALMVIAGGCAGPKYGPVVILGHWAPKIIADNSYALYLTHWPVLLLWEPVVGYHVTTVSDKLRVIAVSFVLAVLIYYPFMKRIQLSKALIHRPHFNLAGFGGATASVAGVALMAALWAPLNIPTATAAAQAKATGTDAVYQAVDLQQLPNNVQPSLATAHSDKAYADCIADLDIKHFKLNKDCIVGAPASKRTVVLFGDSHAWQWASAFDVIGKRQNFRVVLAVKSGCSPEAYTIQNPYFNREYTECDLWRGSALRAIASMKPDAVIVTGRVRRETTHVGVEDTFDKLKATGATLVYMTDTPYPGIDVPNCLASVHKKVSDCATKAKDALQFPDFRAMEASVAKRHGARIINVEPVFCANDVCPVVIGGKIAYFDNSHVTATYSRSLATWLNPKIKAALK